MNELNLNQKNMDPVGRHTLEIISKASQFNQWMYKTIRPFLKGNILEIGSGLGNISRYAIQENLTITLSDINPEYCQILTEHFSGYPNLKEVLSIDLQHPDFFVHYEGLKEKYDTIFLLNVIEHLKHDKNAILNCHLMLKNGGNLIVLAPAYPFLYSGFDNELGHYRRYTQKSLSEIFNASLFEITTRKYFNFAGIFGWLFFEKLLGKKKIGNSEMTIFEKAVTVFKLFDRILLHKAGLSVIITARKKN